jgi:anti-anti-sigma factor
MTEAQAAKRSSFAFERKEGKAPGTVIFSFAGPFTARDMYASLPPIALQNLLDFQSVPDEKQPELNILDIAGVPYVDSSGLGMIVRHYVRCQAKGIRFAISGASPRVLELFKITKVDGFLPLAASLDDLDSAAN